MVHGTHGSKMVFPTTDEPVVYSGPSPRHKPISNAELRSTEQNCRIVNAHFEDEFMRDSLAMLKDKRQPQWSIDAGRD